MPTDELISVERQRLAITRSNPCSFSGRDEANIQLAEVALAAMRAAGIPPDPPDFPDAYLSMRLDTDVRDLIVAACSRRGRPLATSIDHVEAAKSYIAGLFGVRVDRVAVNISQGGEVNNVEGFFLPCCVDEGEVFVPAFFETPVELITHELGHAVHFMLQRGGHRHDPAFWRSRQIEAEVGPYFAQMNYLLAHGSKDEFLQALGVVTNLIYKVTVLSAHFSGLTREEFETSDHLAQFSDAQERRLLVGLFDETKPNQPDMGPFKDLLVSVLNGFGLILALKLVDERSSLVTFMSADSCSIPLMEKLAAAFPHRDDLGSLDDISEVVRRLLARFKH